MQFFQRRIGTRWAYAASGVPTGLRWEAIYPLMDRLGMPPEQWDSLLHDLEVMEDAAIAAMQQRMSEKTKRK